MTVSSSPDQIIATLNQMHRPHTERGHRSDYTICHECGHLWPCNTAQTIDPDVRREAAPVAWDLSSEQPDW